MTFDAIRSDSDSSVSTALPFRLSVLDKSPVAPGETAADALARSVSLARFADAAGYHRYWLAEHHNTAALACPSPEILIAHVLAHTRRIRVGSGGVMLQHYSPYKIAENFNLLASLAPGRVDLGIGKAPGGLPLSTRALQAGYDPARRASFADLADELNRHLQGAATAADTTGQDDATLHATPRPPEPAQPFLLGASAESAALAARLGWAFVYASHLNASPTDLERAFDAYRSASGGRTPLLAASAIVAATRDAAAQLASGHQGFRVQVGDTPAVNVGSLDQAHAYIRQAGGGPHRIDPRETRIVHGTRDDVLHELHALHRRHGIDEFVIDTPLADAAPRIASLRLLAGASADEHGAAASRYRPDARESRERAATPQPDFEGTAR
ncbi:MULTISPECIES: MsnO8 family LLM class oxidoreductase [Burkholderia]|uniref:MsnO8 family LLM class oxidoreductase n=1 Tax=Burkholderia TaxID=32008 RepID=UPI001CF479F3|nr:MsnO8 family LLM class oxidoreductase [Burkholderia cepacia]MCA8054521.1 MsnO8 family LLM class oxidoreductase [Burkholderia cepacia]MCA8131241.1 MsnO8 family LLM class oxidoreductase [Burkholderia cepacia]MDN7611355.1 MsnO8 family LLM class oxidoreductase [Burkholderia cepacia]HEM7891110.1 MsnO8 family LLM class oxidoreductase [Burkholderia cepacia]HEM8509252.1 MsnO8 family LLM class oxidoreductase [Burkholderia cepacia]